MTIQEKLDELTPYVTAIRHAEVPIVDISIPTAWGVPESKKISVTKVESKDTETIKCLIYGNTGYKVSIDELLEYVTKTVKLNIEREKKRILLREQIAKLTELFGTTPLAKLENLRFTFESERIETISLGKLDEDDIDIPVEPMVEEPVAEEPMVEEPMVEEPVVEEPVVEEPVVEEPVVEEPNIHNSNGMRVELPPRKVGKVKVELEDFGAPTCNCSEGQSCPSCTDF